MNPLQKSNNMSSQDQNSSFLALFIRNKKIAVLSCLFIFLIGILSIYQVPKESAPQIDFGTIIVNTVYPGASAVDIDQLVTQEIENKIKDVEGINEISSTSRSGVSSIVIQLEPSTDAETALNDLRNKVDQAKGSLPGDAEDPLIESLQGGEDPLFEIQLVGDLSDTELRDHAEQLKTFLEFDPLVKEVDINGGAEREIQINIKPDLLNQYQLNTTDVLQAIRNSHRDSPIGSLDIDQRDYNLRIQGRHQNQEDIANVLVKSLSGRSSTAQIRVGDVAEVIETGKTTNTITRFFDIKNELPARNTVSLRVINKKDLDIFRADPQLRENVANYQKENLPDSISIYYSLELLKNVQDSYGRVVSSATQSIIMVVIILIFFLRIKEALVASLVIPLAFLCTIAYTFITGATLNFMVNFSMVLALGILVDVSIVIVEGIYEQIKLGKSPEDAAIHALFEFKNPLISGTLTTLAVFIPLMVLPDVLGKFLSFIPISVSVTLIAALLISLFIIPALAAGWIKDEALDELDNKKCGKLMTKINAFYDKRDQIVHEFGEKYARQLKKLLKTRWFRIGGFYGTIVICVLTFFLPIAFTLFPADDFDLIQVKVEMPEGTVKEKTQEATLPVEKILLETPEAEFVRTAINGNEANILIELTEKDIRSSRGLRTSLDISDDWREQFKQFGNYEVQINEAEFGPPSDAPVRFRVIARDSNKLDDARQVAQDLIAMLKDIKGTTNVRDDIINVPGELTYQLNYAELEKLKVDPNTAATAVRTAIDGVEAISLTRGSREIEVRVQFPENSIQDFNDLNNLQIINREGKSIAFGQIVSKKLNPALSEIKRVDRKIALSILSDLTREGNALEVSAEFLEKLANYDKPDGIEIVDAGENAENTALFFALGSGFIIAIVLMFSILVIQFNSFGLPGVIVFTILMSLLGVNIGMWATGIPRSLAFIIGVISLAGIVVNDAIVLVDRINSLRENNPGRDLIDILAEAGSSRLQPIALTTLTTAAGVGPLLLVDKFWAGLSVTIIFGLLVASTLTLFITPAMYYQIVHEAGLSYLPLIIIPGFFLLVAGIFSLNPVMMIIGALLFGGVGYIWLKKYRQMKKAPVPSE